MRIGRLYSSGVTVSGAPRGGARHGAVRNPIRVIPAPSGDRYAFREVCVVTCKKPGVPLRRAQLAGGTRQLIAIPDEAAVDVDREEWDRLAKDVTFVRVDVPVRDYVYHYRLVATIALAEVARQVGRRAPAAAGRPRRRAVL